MIKAWLALSLLVLLYLPLIGRAHDDEEYVAPADDRTKVCEAQLEDELYIMRMHNQHTTFTHMRQKAINSHEHLGDERFAKINTLIDAAENAAHEDTLDEWLNEKWKKCLEVI